MIALAFRPGPRDARQDRNAGDAGPRARPPGRRRNAALGRKRRRFRRRASGLDAAGLFLLLLARTVEDDLAPTGLLALLKHPLCAAGQKVSGTRRQARALERAALRGTRPPPGIDGQRQRLAAARQDRFGPGAAVCAVAEALVDRLADCLPHCWKTRRRQCRTVSARCAPSQKAWRRLRKNRAAGACGPATPARRWPRSSTNWPRRAGLSPRLPCRTCLAARHPDAGPVVRPRYGAHPGSPSRARSSPSAPCRPDRPRRPQRGHMAARPPVDPWMSRPMRLRFGLPSPERRTGLSAHDSPRRYAPPRSSLPAAKRPTAARPWLRAGCSGSRRSSKAGSTRETLRRIRDRDRALPAMAARLDKPARVEPCVRPMPQPPVAVRRAACR